MTNLSLTQVHGIRKHLQLRKTMAPHVGANARLQLLLENSKLNKGHKRVKKMSKFSQDAAADERAITKPRCFLRKQPS